MTSYHDLHITTRLLPRTSIFNLPFDLKLTCTRVGGWELWLDEDRVAGEFVTSAKDGLRLDVAGHVIFDSLTEPG